MEKDYRPPNPLSPDITIEDLNLHIEKSSGYIEGKVRVIITLKNNSGTLIYYVLKRPRNIDYDKGSHTLSICLYEKDLPQDIKDGASPIEPEQIAILPDTTLQWQYLIPVWMKKIMRPPGSRETVEVLDISGVEKVVCIVAFHTSPFRITPSDQGGSVPTDLSRWGQTVSASFERRLV